MNWRVFALSLCLCGSSLSKAQEQLAVLPDAPRPQPGIIVGTVVDVNNDPVPSANVALQSATLKSPRTVVANENGFFEFNGLEPGNPYLVTIAAPGFANWTSRDVTLKPGQYLILTGAKLHIAEAVTTVTVGYPTEEVAAQQAQVLGERRVPVRERDAADGVDGCLRRGGNVQGGQEPAQADCGVRPVSRRRPGGWRAGQERDDAP